MNMEEVSRAEWERAQAAFYPFVQGFELALNPEDVDEILYAVLRHSRSTAEPEQITAEVEAQIRDHHEGMRRMWEGLSRQAHSTGGALPEEERAWVVWRQDDHGNKVVVARYASRGDADREAAAMESRGHKQTYWVAHQDS